MLPRKQLRLDVLQALLGHTAAGDRVFDSRLITITDQELPCIDVFTTAELPEGNLLNITLEVFVFCAVAGAEPTQGALDDLCGQVMDSLKQWASPHCLPPDYTGTDIQLVAEAERPHAIAKISYNTQFFDP